MVVLVGANINGDTFVIHGQSGSVSGGPNVSNVSGIQALDGDDVATVNNNNNLYNGINLAGGNDTLSMTKSNSAAIDLGEGDNVADISGGMIYGQISSGSGEDDITLNDTAAHGGVSTGGGNDNLTATGDGHTYIGALDTGDGDDNVTLDGVEVHTGFDTGDGDDTVSITDTEVDPVLRTGEGEDTIIVSGGSVINNGIETGTGKDTVSVSDSRVNGDIRTGDGDDLIQITNSLLNNGVRSGAGSDIVSVSDGSTVWGMLDGGSGMDYLVLPVGTVVTDSVNGTFTIESGMTYVVSSGRFVLPSGRTIHYTNFESSGSTIPCFTTGTMIDTPLGPVAVEDLQVGDEVMTMDRGAVPVEWIGTRSLSAVALRAYPNRRPVRIPAGALAQGVPAQDLIVSPQHRVLIDSDISMRMTGSAQLLLPAVKLVGYNGIERISPADGVVYVHFTCRQHEVVFSNGCPTESLYLGPQTLASLSDDARAELLDLFPEFNPSQGIVPAHARPVLQKGTRIGTLLKRHEKNGKALQRHLH
ncbi:Hint domain-containing protein [Chachezhania sediminis]|uniref:Hint domain-containing protein n=1 Tax=Chachezhania sediminis TaxID=2599291 RepID=UPI00131E2B28|nr:Hint domain-containing protein [Chachezhania sediminis]